jgi:hypothetical protein
MAGLAPIPTAPSSSPSSPNDASGPVALRFFPTSDGGDSLERPSVVTTLRTKCKTLGPSRSAYAARAGLRT